MLAQLPAARELASGCGEVVGLEVTGSQPHVHVGPAAQHGCVVPVGQVEG